MTVKCALGSLWPSFANFQLRNNDEREKKKSIQDFYLFLTYFAFQKTAPQTLQLLRRSSLSQQLLR